MKKKRENTKEEAQQLIEETILLLYRGSFQSLRLESKGYSKKGCWLFHREKELFSVKHLPLETERAE